MDDDVRNVGARLVTGIAATVCGVTGAYAAAKLAGWLIHHPAPHTGGLGTGQDGFFALASIIFGFILGGAIGGITIEAIRWRMHRRHRLPRMVLVRRSACR